MTRPKKAPGEVRAIIVRVRVTDEERSDLQLAADHERLDLSTWLRRLGLKEATRIKEGASAKSAGRRTEHGHETTVGRRRLKLDTD
jgi:hypothetical protein